MAKNNNELPKYGMPSAIPSAPANGDNNDLYPHLPPPPSYEESMRQQAAQQQFYPNHTTNAPPVYNPTQYANYHQPHYNHLMTNIPGPQMGSPSNQQVKAHMITLAKGAELRTTADGAISIPPPPPGCAATPAQLAAMQGKPVVVKKPKRSFF